VIKVCVFAKGVFPVMLPQIVTNRPINNGQIWRHPLWQDCIVWNAAALVVAVADFLGEVFPFPIYQVDIQPLLKTV
jgi:hypothetical protein